MKPIITGVLGYGYSGKVFHCPFVHAHDYFRLKSIVSRNSDDALKDYPYINLLRDYEEMLNDETIELIIITTPNHLHFEHAKKALKKGKHVLVEKPYATTYKEALTLNRIADEKGLFISSYQNRRYDGDYLTLEKLKKNGSLDKIHEVNMVWDRLEPVEVHSWREGGLKGADLVYDLGSHLLDQALTLFGEPKTFSSISKKIREGSLIKDWFEIQLDYGDYIARIKASLGAIYKEPRYVIQTDKQAYLFHEMGEQVGQLVAGIKPLSADYGDNAFYDIYEVDGSKSSKQVVKGNYLRYYTQMAKAIREGAAPEVTKEQAALVIKYLEQV